MKGMKLTWRCMYRITTIVNNLWPRYPSFTFEAIGGTWSMQTYLEGHLGQAIVCLQWILQARAYDILKLICLIKEHYSTL